MERRIEYQIRPEDSEDYRIILDVLKKKFRLTVRQIRTSKFTPDGILLNGSRATVRRPVVPGDRLSILLEEKEPASALEVRYDEGVQVPLHILYEDEDVVVLNKPAGYPVHPSHGHYADTMANALCAHYQEMGQTLIPRAVGRLDKDTSGAILFAKNRTAASRLSRRDSVSKTYLALASGEICEDSFTISLPIAREEEHLNRMCVSPEGKPAVTHARVLKRFPGYTLLRLTLETGRTHQIRVHLASAGHPLLGGPIYGSVTTAGLSRALLHCEALTFVHPFTEKEIRVEAPLPPYFRRLSLTRW